MSTIRSMPHVSIQRPETKGGKSLGGVVGGRAAAELGAPRTPREWFSSHVPQLNGSSTFEGPLGHGGSGSGGALKPAISDPKLTYAAYARYLGSLTPSQLTAERARIEAYRKDALTTAPGLPASAASEQSAVSRADAMLKQINQEQARRTGGTMPSVPVGLLPQVQTNRKRTPLEIFKYAVAVSLLTPTERKQEQATLNAALFDATHGPHRDPVAADNLRRQLKALELLGLVKPANAPDDAW